MRVSGAQAKPDYTDSLPAEMPPRGWVAPDLRTVLAAELLKRWGLEPLREHGGGVQGTVAFAADLAEAFYQEVERRGWEAGPAT